MRATSLLLSCASPASPRGRFPRSLSASGGRAVAAGRRRHGRRLPGSYFQASRAPPTRLRAALSSISTVYRTVGAAVEWRQQRAHLWAQEVTAAGVPSEVVSASAAPWPARPSKDPAASHPRRSEQLHHHCFVNVPPRPHRSSGVVNITQQPGAHPDPSCFRPPARGRREALRSICTRAGTAAGQPAQTGATLPARYYAATRFGSGRLSATRLLLRARTKAQASAVWPAWPRPARRGQRGGTDLFSSPAAHDKRRRQRGGAADPASSSWAAAHAET